MKVISRTELRKFSALELLKEISSSPLLLGQKKRGPGGKSELGEPFAIILQYPVNEEDIRTLTGMF